jgi:hypothetical protein
LRHLRTLNDLRSRYERARVEEIRQVILVSGGLACEDEPRVHLLPSWKVIGGLPPEPDYVVSDDDACLADCATIDAIA